MLNPFRRHLEALFRRHGETESPIRWTGQEAELALFVDRDFRLLPLVRSTLRRLELRLGQAAPMLRLHSPTAIISILEQEMWARVADGNASAGPSPGSEGEDQDEPSVPNLRQGPHEWEQCQPRQQPYEASLPSQPADRSRPCGWRASQDARLHLLHPGREGSEVGSCPGSGNRPARNSAAGFR